MQIDNAKTLEDSIYELEALCYYFQMKPSEFWNATYREVLLYCQVNLAKVSDDFRQDIVIQEATTDKLIQADAMREKPKVIPLKKMFKKLFK